MIKVHYSGRGRSHFITKCHSFYTQGLKELHYKSVLKSDRDKETSRNIKMTSAHVFVATVYIICGREMVQTERFHST